MTIGSDWPENTLGKMNLGDPGKSTYVVTGIREYYSSTRIIGANYSIIRIIEKRRILEILTASIARSDTIVERRDAGARKPKEPQQGSAPMSQPAA